MRRAAGSIAAALAVFLIFAAGPARAAGGDPADTARLQYIEAVEAVKKADYREAVSLLTEVLLEEPRNADALNYMGYSHRKLGDFKRALTYYLQALEIEPDHRGANEYIGETYLEMKRPDKARFHLERLARICGPDCEEYLDLKKAFDAYAAAGNRS